MSAGTAVKLTLRSAEHQLFNISPGEAAKTGYVIAADLKTSSNV